MQRNSREVPYENEGGTIVKQEMMTVLAQKELAPKIYEMTLTGKLVKEMTIPGQFLHLKAPRADLLLRRPISLASVDQKNASCKLIYRTEGVGTELFSQLVPDDQVDVMGPLGNGFPIEFLGKEDLVFIIGGGIGVPPLFELAKKVKEKGSKIVFFLGFAKKEVIFYEQEFAQMGEVHLSTDDGSYGVKGHVGTMLTKVLQNEKPTAVYSCGSNGLLKAVDHYFADLEHAYLSLEARMACGMGACYACVCPTRADRGKSKKICDEGPVFSTGEVIL